MTKVVHLKDEPYDVLIDRRTKWGNPFVIGVHGTREEIIAKYKNYVLNDLKLMLAIPELRDKTLGCWCKPLPCHGDVLVELVNEFVRKRI